MKWHLRRWPLRAAVGATAGGCVLIAIGVYAPASADDVLVSVVFGLLFVVYVLQSCISASRAGKLRPSDRRQSTERVASVSHHRRWIARRDTHV